MSPNRQVREETGTTYNKIGICKPVACKNAMMQEENSNTERVYKDENSVNG